MTHLTEETFKPRCRELFAFLCEDYGFEEEQGEGDRDRFRLRYSSDRITVMIESVSWGTRIRVGLGRRSGFEDYDLEDLLSLRGGPEIGECSPSTQAERLADALQAYAGDVLAGDTTVFSDLKRLVRRALRAERYFPDGRPQGVLGWLRWLVQRILG